MPQRHRVASLIALGLWTLVVFSSALGAGLLNWDDPLYLTGSRAVRDFDWAEMFTGELVGNYHPLTMLTFALEHWLFGFDPFVFHLDNVLLHVANTLLVVVWVRRLLPGRELVALASGALFAVHPLHVESVAWVSERKDVLSVFFYLLSLLAYLAWVERGGGRRYALVLATLVAALLAKPMAVTAPVVMLAIDWQRRRPVSRQMWLEKVPLFGLSVAVGIANLAVQAPVHVGDRVIYGLGWLERLGLGLESLTFYLAKTIWPAKLSAIYDMTLSHVGPTEAALSLVLVGALGVWAWRDRAARRDAAFAAAFFLVTIAPVLKVIPFGSHSLFNDRYMYLPSVGLFLLFALPFRGLGGWPVARRGAALGAWALVLLALSVQSHARGQVWQSSEALWLDVLENQPGASTALNNLGRHYLDESGDLDRAEALFQQAATARPDSPDSHYNLGQVAWRRGDRAAAARFFERALEIWPDGATNRMQVARFYADGGELQKAAAHYRRVVADLPEHAELRHNLGDLYRAMGQVGRAREAYEQALEVDPGLGPTHAALAALALEQGARARARASAQRARSLGARLPPDLLALLREGDAAGPVPVD